jgi:hypothetical protein
MCNESQTISTSHFSIGGIHGLPFVQWEGAGGTHPTQGSGWGGYCTHGSVLFPTWHRPYVALYEVSPISRRPAYTTLLIELNSKCCRAMLLTLLRNTKLTEIVGQPLPRTFEHLIGIGLAILSRLPRLSLFRPFPSLPLTVARLMCRTPSISTLSTPSTHLSQTHTRLGRPRSDTRTTPVARTRPRMSKP